jgi:type VI protein secretion system component Hcp
MKRVLVATAATLTMSVGFPFSAAAQSTETFMLVPGIPGQSVNEAFKDWIEVSSVAQSFTGGRNTACTVVAGKFLDPAGPKLWAAAVTGQVLGDVKIDITRPSGEVPNVVLYELVLTNTLVTAINSTPSALTEQVTLAGSTATLRYFPRSSTGGVLPVVQSTITCK